MQNNVPEINAALALKPTGEELKEAIERKRRAKADRNSR